MRASTARRAEQLARTRRHPRARRRGRLRVRRPAAHLEHLRRASAAALGGPAAGAASRAQAALLTAYHARAENPGDRDVLLRAVEEAGLDVERAAEILDADDYGAEVRERERHWQQLGILSVPAVIVDAGTRSGRATADVFEPRGCGRST